MNKLFVRGPLIRDISEYDKTLWLSDIPHEHGCFTQAWGRDEEHEPDEWMEVQNRREPELPAIPAPCKDWVNLTALRNKDDLPELFPDITREIQNPDWREGLDEPESILCTERLEDHPEIKRAWDRYVEDRWLPWTEEHNAWEKVHKVYSSLFAIHQEQLRLGEEYELGLGFGLLTWQTPTRQRVRRHLVVADAILEFEARLGKFIVRPHTEGAKLRPELDMLDIEEQPARAEETAKASLEAAEDNPWEKGCIEGVLQALVHSINSQGDYDTSLETKNTRASAKPIVEYAPALILRKRSEKGLTETLKRIKEQIEDGTTIPGEFADLAEIRPKDSREPSDGSEEVNTVFDGEVFFPKPSNEEQRRIVEKIRAASGVLVQGPPGTGKSHTIANLICHLLATGQRTLITAKTPRALQVLEGLIPNGLRPLCINLLGSGLEEKRSLETSVGGILRKNEEWNMYYAEQDRMELEGRLHELRKEKAKINRRLQDIRESETHTQSVAEGTYRGTAARIAKAVNRERPNYEWFTDSVSLDKTCPISGNDLRSVLVALRQFTPEKRLELGLAWPEALPLTEHFVNLVRKEAKVAEQEGVLANGAEERIVACLSTSEVASIEGILHSLQAFHHECKNLFTMQKPWIREAVSDVSNGDTSLWREIVSLPDDPHDLRNLLDSLRQYTPTRREELRLSLPDILKSEDEIVNLFNADRRAAEEKKRCLLDGADIHTVNHLVPKPLVCGSCRKPLDCQEDCMSVTETEQIVACPHCGKRNLVRLTTIQSSAQSILDALSAFRSHLQQCLASNHSWMKDAVREIVGNNSGVWSERLRVTQQAVCSIERLVSLADETDLDLSACASLSHNAVFEDVSNLRT